jgi:toxin ParE1/3/4
MTVFWTDPALADLAALHDYIANDDPAAADAMVLRIVDLVERQLPRMPESGRPGRVHKTRELVEILRVIHGARRWPESE